MIIFDLFEFDDLLQVMDVGASAITGVPIYKKLMELELAHLTAFDGDPRQIDQIRQTYGMGRATIHNTFLFDGKPHQAYLCSPDSGMSSLLKPKQAALQFFNGFSEFGAVHTTQDVQTTRLDDVKDVAPPDFLKMDVQGAELEVLKHGSQSVQNCLAMQLEVSFFPLYEGQPSFGEIDVYMRGLGFVPHMFQEVKHWSIAPTVFNKNIRTPGNQLLEADIIYIKDPLCLHALTDPQLKKLVILSHYAFKSVDLCVYLLKEMEQRGLVDRHAHQLYMSNVSAYS